MPIAQERLISLIECAEILGGRIRELKTIAILQNRILQKDGIDSAVRNLNLLQDIHQKILAAATFPEEITATISVEKHHFSKSRHKNMVGRAAAARWRTGQKQNFDITQIPGYLKRREEESTPDTVMSGISIIPQDLPQLDDIIPLIEDGFADNPNRDKTLDNEQINSLLTQLTDIEDLYILANMVQWLLNAKVIQSRYRKGQGPEGIFIRGTKLGGKPNAATSYGQELV